jgi:hypothetical protein
MGCSFLFPRLCNLLLPVIEPVIEPGAFSAALKVLSKGCCYWCRTMLRDCTNALNISGAVNGCPSGMDNGELKMDNSRG